MRGLIIKEVYKDHPPIFAAICLNRFIASQGATPKEAKKNLFYCFKVQRVFCKNDYIKRPPIEYFKYAKKNPKSCFYFTKKHINQWRVISAPNGHGSPGGAVDTPQTKEVDPRPGGSPC